MTHVVTDKCIRCKYTDCVEVCPVECFHEAKNMLVINPDECIDCGVCVAECPIGAIQSEIDAEPIWLEINSKYAKKFPRILEKKMPMAEAEVYKDVVNKEKFLNENDE
ncbi:Ferredoxin-2 [Candidatus Fokinia solitaria]|uniref:Ferredoxin n=1 Tax=Candidatus Fokinia solitaria TaxID=1802984 RepID=A0A2U8BRK6_9RICK|nr:ferredoxin FdxA [Candidatus Fokinia solitaria]AWD32972.1 Ferredoxin-2 [Candidatus Fokinia solitaria]